MCGPPRPPDRTPRRASPAKGRSPVPRPLRAPSRAARSTSAARRPAARAGSYFETVCLCSSTSSQVSAQTSEFPASYFQVRVPRASRLTFAIASLHFWIPGPMSRPLGVVPSKGIALSS
eukprot:4641512-Prymnesium_polylepis.2